MNDHHQQSPSPGARPIKAKDCIEELLKFTLTSSVDGTLGLDIGLSKDYCSKLLNDDDGPEINPTSDIAEGVPINPLYKRLASALYQSLSFGAFRRPYDRMPLMDDDSSLKHKEVAWIALFMEKGSGLINVLENVDFEIHVQEPFFSQLKDGVKTVEGRCAVGDYNPATIAYSGRHYRSYQEPAADLIRDRAGWLGDIRLAYRNSFFQRDLIM